MLCYVLRYNTSAPPFWARDFCHKPVVETVLLVADFSLICLSRTIFRFDEDMGDFSELAVTPGPLQCLCLPLTLPPGPTLDDNVGTHDVEAYASSCSGT
jgi:hypothetical protein